MSQHNEEKEAIVEALAQVAKYRGVQLCTLQSLKPIVGL